MNFLISRAVEILRREGLAPLVSRCFKYLLHYVFRYGTFYLYEHSINKRDEDLFRPKIQNSTFRIVATNEQADDLVKEGIEDIRRTSVMVNVRKCLDGGAIAFCFFVGQELAHIGWIALSKEAKNCFDILPYRVYFSNRQACTGGTVTLPKYRGKGFMQYGYYKRFQFLQDNGYSTSRNAVERNNKAAQRAHQKFDPKIYAKARYLKFVFLRLWKEVPLDNGPIDKRSALHEVDI